MEGYIISPEGTPDFLTPALTSFAYEGDVYFNLDEFDFTNTIFTRVELEAKILELETVYNDTEYARLRKAEYDLLNQFELRAEDALNGTTIWMDSILAIKAQFPKPV